MPSIVFRNRLVNSIDFALREAAGATSLDHPGLTGRVRELCAERLLRPMLPTGFEVGTGKICDRHGTLTSEADLVIHSPAVLPPIMHSQRDGVFAVEATFYMFEVKSRLTSAEVRDSVQKARQLVALDAGNREAGTNLSWTVPVLFAFDSDLVASSSDLERYSKHDPTWKTDPLFKAICVAGRGYWYADQAKSCWYFHPPTDEHDEIIDLVSGISNTLAKRRHALPVANLGNYLMAARSVTPCT